MKLTNLTLAALLLALSGPAFATDCTTGFAIGADGDCEMVTEEDTTEPTTVEVDDPDNVGAFLTEEVEEEETPSSEPDPDDAAVSAD